MMLIALSTHALEDDAVRRRIRECRWIVHARAAVNCHRDLHRFDRTQNEANRLDSRCWYNICYKEKKERRKNIAAVVKFPYRSTHHVLTVNRRCGVRRRSGRNVADYLDGIKIEFHCWAVTIFWPMLDFDLRPVCWCQQHPWPAKRQTERLGIDRKFWLSNIKHLWVRIDRAYQRSNQSPGRCGFPNWRRDRRSAVLWLPQESLSCRSRPYPTARPRNARCWWWSSLRCAE